MNALFLFSAFVMKRLSLFNLFDDPQSRTITAEIQTFTLVSTLYYQANYRVTRMMCLSYLYFPEILTHVNFRKALYYLEIEPIPAIPSKKIRKNDENKAGSQKKKESKTTTHN